jgi:hypothetical protein
MAIRSLFAMMGKFLIVAVAVLFVISFLKKAGRKK